MVLLFTSLFIKLSSLLFQWKYNMFYHDMIKHIYVYKLCIRKYVVEIITSFFFHLKIRDYCMKLISTI